MSNTSYKPTSLLPKVYPENEHALDIAGGVRIDSISLELQRVKTLANPTSCPVEFLPFLAYSFGSDFYWELQNLSESEQRAMIGNSLQLHRKKGTVWAIKKVLEILGFDIEVIEWWEDKDNPLDINPTKPYTFAVILDVAKFYKNSKRILSESEQRRVLKYLDIYKNVRSKFDFYLRVCSENNMAMSTSASIGEIVIERAESLDFKIDKTNVLGAIAVSNMRDTAVIEMINKNEQQNSKSEISFATAVSTAEILQADSKIHDFELSSTIKIDTVVFSDIRDTAEIKMKTNQKEEVKNEMTIPIFTHIQEIICL